jgi:hypothetical protein
VLKKLTIQPYFFVLVTFLRKKSNPAKNNPVGQAKKPPEIENSPISGGFPD